MNKLALGVDVASVERISALLERQPKFADRVFTQAEQEYCGHHPERWAARWAAKEAVRKLAGELGRPLPAMHDVEVSHGPGGAPVITVDGWDAAIAVSITHDAGLAMVTVAAFEPRRRPFIDPPPEFRLPERPETGNKGTFGRVVVIAGSVGLTGAAYFASHAAARSGAGLTTLLTPNGAYQILAAMSPDVMVHPLSDLDGALGNIDADDVRRHYLHNADAVVIGPGLGQGEATTSAFAALMDVIAAPTVVDADGLNIAATTQLVWKKYQQPIAITPHPGEMSRLCGTPVIEITANPDEVAASYARSHGVVVILKGSRTVIAAPDGRTYAHAHPQVALATGGTGDVLAGLIGGFAAQGMSMFDAAIAGVVVHSEAGADVADRVGKSGATASDLLSATPGAQQRLRQATL